MLPGRSVGSKKVLSPKSKVKFYFSTVRSRVIPILKRVEVGDYPSKIARIYGWSKQHVHYYLKKLQKADLVRRQVRSSVVFYELTNKGKELLASAEGLVFGSGVFRLHKCQVLFPILREGCYPRGSFREVELTNWTQLLGLERGVSVCKTTRHWIVHVETLYGRHPGELFGLAKNLGDRVARSMVLKYGVVLGEGKIGRGYELAIDDPVAKLLARYFTVSTPKRKMDHSPGELKGEIDHLSRDAAVEYLMMPERVKKLEGQILGLSSLVEDLRSDVSQLVQVLKEVAAPKENRSVPLKDGRYIS
jgi:DNA-binding MarR family transcriptional regulator